MRWPWVSVKGAGSPTTLFRLRSSFTYDWDQVADSGSDSAIVETNLADVFLIVELDYDIISVPPPQWYDFAADLQYRDPITLEWFMLDAELTHFARGY